MKTIFSLKILYHSTYRELCIALNYPFVIFFFKYIVYFHLRVHTTYTIMIVMMMMMKMITEFYVKNHTYILHFSLEKNTWLNLSFHFQFPFQYFRRKIVQIIFFCAKGTKMNLWILYKKCLFYFNI